MNINMLQIPLYIWIIVAILVIVVAFAVIRFFWRHILRYLLHGCVTILGILALLWLLHYFRVF
ncbi:MAG: hypothetical protein WCE68_06620 [Anaerolineales bacterium]